MPVQFLILLLFLLGCDKDSQAQLFDEKLSLPFTDSRDGKQYKTTKVGTLVLMADNLDYDTGDSLSWCYENDCKKYGRLYTWEKAQIVCPSGWHLPSASEWSSIDDAVPILPDGYCNDVGNKFDKWGWWTSTNAEKKGTYIHNPEIRMHIAPGDYFETDLGKFGCTVRCVQDNPNIDFDAIWESMTMAKKAFIEYGEKVDSSLKAKYKSTTAWCRTVEQDTAEISKFAKKDIYLKNFITYFYNIICVNPAEITAYLLNSTAKKYEMQFNKKVPQCKQCTDLELFIMLEDAIRTKTPELGTPVKQEDAALKADLQKTKAQYENKFKIRAPWWYMCSDKEHLERLQKAVKTNTPDYDLSYSYLYSNYRIGKRLAEYERRFKKQAPKWIKKEFSDDEMWKLLIKALEENKPILTKEEEAEMAKDRHIFQFKYGRYTEQAISISKTPTGAILKYQLPSVAETKRWTIMGAGKWRPDTLSANLSAEEWQNFTKALQEIGVMNWNKSYIPAHKGHRGWRGEKSWEVEIFLPGVPDTARFRSFGYYVYPPDWDKFMKLMESIKKRASQDLENKLKVEYEKRFKKPITEQELTTEVVDFDLDLKNKTSVHKSSFIVITRTASGATVHYRTGPKEGVKLSTEDWLDFIKAFYGSSFMNWDKSFGSARPAGQKDDVYRLNIYNSNNTELLEFDGFNKYPPNWDKFIKVINDVRAKVKKDNVTKEMESKMKTEYQKKFKKPISEFELSIKSMRYHDVSRAIDQSVDIHLNRTATGAIIEYKVGRRDDNTKLKAELSMGEWLDFLNSLQQCPENSYYEGKWKRNDMCCRKNAQDYKFLDIPYMWGLEISSSGDTDEMEFYARDICLPKWNEFVKTLDVKKK